MSTIKTPGQVCFDTSNDTTMSTIKTPGQVCFDTWNASESGRFTPWHNSVYKAYWEAAAAAVIAHHEAQKPQPWTLPAPPAGREWHRNDWTAETLPDGWRPLLKDEHEQQGDEAFVFGNWVKVYDVTPPQHMATLRRTRRPLPPAHEVKITLPALTLNHGNPSIGGVVTVTP